MQPLPKVLTPRNVLFLALLLAASFGAGSGLTSYLTGSLTIDPIPPLSLSATEQDRIRELNLRYDRMKTNLDATAEEAKRIDRLMTLLLALSSLYAIALGLHSYFGVEQVLRTAKENSDRLRQDSERTIEKARAELDSAKDQFENFRKEIREQYPQFAGLHHNLLDLVRGMNSVFRDGEDWTMQELTPQKRQQLLMTEQRLAGLEVFRLDEIEDYRPQMLRMWQGLGRFYTSLFRAGNDRNDWERAHLYFKKAIRMIDVSAVVWKDYGVHLCEIELAAPVGPRWITEEREIEDLRIEAEAAFHQSLKLKAEQPGALFGLGWIYFVRRSYTIAIEQNLKVTKITSWDKQDRKKYLGDAWRNLACCRICNQDSEDAIFKDLECWKTVATEEGIVDEWRISIREDETVSPFLNAHSQRASSLMS